MYPPAATQLRLDAHLARQPHYLRANQIGDSVKTTLETYSHLFDGTAHAEKSRAAMDADFGDMANSWQTRGPESSETEQEAEVVNIASVQGKR